jgi:hypothetical protein
MFVFLLMVTERVVNRHSLRRHSAMLLALLTLAGACHSSSASDAGGEWNASQGGGAGGAQNTRAGSSNGVAGSPGGESGGAGGEQNTQAGTSNGVAGSTGGTSRELAYVTGLLNGVFVCSIDLESGAPSLLPGYPVGTRYTVAIAKHPTQRFVYVDVTNAFSTQHVSGFAISQSTGALEEVPGSPFMTAFPFSVAVDPSGRFVYVGNDDVDQTSVYALDRSSGELRAIDGSPFSLGGLTPEFAFAALP